MLGERKSSGKATTTRKARKGNCCHPRLPRTNRPPGETETNSRGHKGQIEQKGLKKGKCKRISFRIIKNLQRPTTVSYRGRFKVTPSHPPRPIPPPRQKPSFCPQNVPNSLSPAFPIVQESKAPPPRSQKKSPPHSAPLCPPSPPSKTSPSLTPHLQNVDIFTV